MMRGIFHAQCAFSDPLRKGSSPHVLPLHPSGLLTWTSRLKMRLQKQHPGDGLTPLRGARDQLSGNSMRPEISPGVGEDSETGPMMGDTPSGVVARRTLSGSVASFG